MPADEQTVPVPGTAPNPTAPQAEAKGSSWKTLLAVAVLVALGGSLVGCR